MIARRTVAVVAALMVLGGAVALAQEDNVLQRYDLAVENLQFAVDSVPGDLVQARDELERAVNALLTLSRDTTSATLLDAMQRTFERARTAVENQSGTDMAVQAAVLKGGFRRLVADSAYTAGAAGDLETARSRLAHLATEMGFAASDMDALAAATSTDALRFAFEAGAAEVIATELAVAQRLAPTDGEAAYVSLATAYGDSLLVQDSPRADPALNSSLSGAAQALVQGDMEAFAAAGTDATAQLSRLAAAARANEAGTPRAPAPSQAAPEVPDTQDASQSTSDAVGQPPVVPEEAGGQAGLPAIGEVTDDAPGGLQDAPVAQAGGPQSDAADQQGDDPATESVPSAATLAMVRAQVEQEQEAARRDRLVASLEAAGLPAGLARTQATALLDAGVTEIGTAFDAVAARVDRAIAALRSGDAAAAEDHVAAARAAFDALRPAVAARDAATADETYGMFAAVLDRPGLREHDLTLLAAQVERSRARLTTAATDAGLELERAVDGIWAGWPRLIVLFALLLLAFVPIRYLNLAFGGGNANWRMVAWALFLLVLPIVYEGVAALGSAVADLADMPALDVLARWSMFNSTSGHLVWAALSLIALLLATSGLRGIAAQFGLLGGRGATQQGSSPTIVETTGVRSQTAVDWDDEF